jgi:hypothetical protein
LGTLENANTQKISGNLGIFVVLNNLGLIVKVEFFCCCPPFWVLSHMKENMLSRTTLEVLANMTGYF